MAKGKNISNICEHIKYYRKERNLTQSEVAAKLGLTVRGYQQYEGNRISITINTMIELAELFKITPIELLYGPFEKMSEAQKKNLFIKNDGQNTYALFSVFISDLQLLIKTYSNAMQNENSDLYTFLSAAGKLSG